MYIFFFQNMFSVYIDREIKVVLPTRVVNNLENFEKRTQRLEDFQTTTIKDIDDLKEGINFTGQQLKEKTEAAEKAHRLCETQLAELTTKCQKK